MYPDSEILFPSRCIPQLRDLRGPEWAELIDHIAAVPDGHEDVLGFSLMMIRLGSCLTCDLDSYRASLGCCTCAGRSVAVSRAPIGSLFAYSRRLARKCGSTWHRTKSLVP